MLDAPPLFAQSSSLEGASDEAAARVVGPALLVEISAATPPLTPDASTGILDDTMQEAPAIVQDGLDASNADVSAGTLPSGATAQIVGLSIPMELSVGATPCIEELVDLASNAGGAVASAIPAQVPPTSLVVLAGAPTAAAEAPSSSGQEVIWRNGDVGVAELVQCRPVDAEATAKGSRPSGHICAARCWDRKSCSFRRCAKVAKELSNDGKLGEFCAIHCKNILYGRMSEPEPPPPRGAVASTAPPTAVDAPAVAVETEGDATIELDPHSACPKKLSEAWAMFTHAERLAIGGESKGQEMAAVALRDLGYKPEENLRVLIANLRKRGRDVLNCFTREVTFRQRAAVEGLLDVIIARRWHVDTPKVAAVTANVIAERKRKYRNTSDGEPTAAPPKSPKTTAAAKRREEEEGGTNKEDVRRDKKQRKRPAEAEAVMEEFATPKHGGTEPLTEAPTPRLKKLRPQFEESEQSAQEGASVQVMLDMHHLALQVQTASAPLPLTFSSTDEYFDKMGGAALDEVRVALAAARCDDVPMGEWFEVKIWLSQCQRGASGKGLVVLDAIPVHKSSRSIVREGSLVKLGEIDAPVAVCIAAPDWGRFRLSLEENLGMEWLALSRGRGVRRQLGGQAQHVFTPIVVAEPDVLTLGRSYAVCRRRRPPPVLFEVLDPRKPRPTKFSSNPFPAEPHHWEVVSNYPLQLRASMDERDYYEPLTMVPKGAKLLVHEVREVTVEVASEEAGSTTKHAQRWLRLRGTTGRDAWLPDAKFGTRDKQGENVCLPIDVELRRFCIHPPSLSASALEDLEHERQENRTHFNRQRDEAIQQIAGLNYSQQSAVTDFLEGHGRCNCIHGPPGTGKSHTITALLRALTLGKALPRRRLVLVCATTNKAVQVLLEAFLHEMALAAVELDVPLPTVALAGVEDQLPASAAKSWDGKGAPALAPWDVFVHQPLTAALQRLHAIRERMALHGGVRAAGLALVRLIDFLRGRTSLFKVALADVFENLPCDSREGLASLIDQASECLERVRLDGVRRDELEEELLSSASVIFCTLATAGRPKLQEHLARRRVACAIVDESAQAIEGETLLILPYLPQKLLLVGDPNQLTATVVSESGRTNQWGRSLMQRLFDAGYPRCMLEEQHRMAPEIASFPARWFYEGRLQNAPAVSKSTPVDREASSCVVEWKARSDSEIGRLPRYVVIDVRDGCEATSEYGHVSISNKEEARLAVSLASSFLELGTENNVAVLTFYRSQRSQIEMFAARKGFLSKWLESGRLAIHTVDSFQGSEADVVILSCVRTSSLGFLTDFRRLNVAITRAKRRLVLLANVGRLAASARGRKNGAHVAELLRDAGQRDLILDIALARGALQR